MPEPALYPAKSEYAKWIEKGKETVVLNTRSEAYYRLNETAGKICRLCNGTRTPLKIATAISAIYRCDGTRLKTEVSSIIDIFRKRGIIKLYKTPSKFYHNLSRSYAEKI